MVQIRRIGPVLARAKGIIADIPDNLRNPHSAVRQTLTGCRSLEPDLCGFLNYSGEPGIETRVSRKQLRRAMRIAQGFINAVVARGHTVSLSEEGRGPVVLNVNGATLGFSMSESMIEVPDRTDAAGVQLFRCVPSGSLSLCMFARPRYLAHGRRHRDGRTFLLESRLALAIPDLEAMAAQAVGRQQKERERERLYLPEERRRERREQATKRQKKIADVLRETVDAMKLVNEAMVAAQQIKERCPGSKWAISLATWLERAARKLGSPRHLARTIPVEIWAALGMSTKSARSDFDAV